MWTDESMQTLMAKATKPLPNICRQQDKMIHYKGHAQYKFYMF